MPLSRISGHGQTNNNVDNAVIMISHSHSHSGTSSDFRFRFEHLSEVSSRLSIHNVIALSTLHSTYGGKKREDRSCRCLCRRQ